MVFGLRTLVFGLRSSKNVYRKTKAKDQRPKTKVLRPKAKDQNEHFELKAVSYVISKSSKTNVVAKDQTVLHD